MLQMRIARVNQKTQIIDKTLFVTSAKRLLNENKMSKHEHTQEHRWTEFDRAFILTSVASTISPWFLFHSDSTWLMFHAMISVLCASSRTRHHISQYIMLRISSKMIATKSWKCHDLIFWEYQIWRIRQRANKNTLASAIHHEFCTCFYVGIVCNFSWDQIQNCHNTHTI